jgi:trigger factor
MRNNILNNIKKLKNSQIELEITVPWSEWKKYLDQVASEASQELKISGFRPGKAPRNLVEQKVGKTTLLNNAAEKAVSKSYAEFVTKEKLEMIGSPKVELKEIFEGQDLKYSAVASVMPQIKVEGSYKKDIKKINEEYVLKTTEAKVKEEDIALELDKLAASRVKLVTVRREARKNDSVEVDFEVFVAGSPIENGKSLKHPLVLGKGVFIPGFEENILGMKEGEKKEFTLNFPGEYHKKDLAGKPATFKVKLHVVQERQIPEINDDFAKSLGNFSDLSALKDNIKGGLEHENIHRLKDEKRAKYIEKIVENSEVDLPEILVHEELHTMIHEFEHQLESMGMNMEKYLENLKKKKEDLEKEWEPQAKKRVISALALKEIVRDDELEVEAREIEVEMNKVLKHYENVKDFKKNIDMERLYNYSRGVLENEKVFEMLENL